MAIFVSLFSFQNSNPESQGLNISFKGKSSTQLISQAPTMMNDE
jgi:hypothetical protein